MINFSKETTREVEDRLRTAEQLSMRGETNGQKEQIVNELVKSHQQYLSRINQTRSLLHTMINYYKNILKIETQLINNGQTISSLPSDIRSTEVLVRQYETEREKIIQTYEQCRQDALLAENKAKQVGFLIELVSMSLQYSVIRKTGAKVELSYERTSSTDTLRWSSLQRLIVQVKTLKGIVPLGFSSRVMDTLHHIVLIILSKFQSEQMYCSRNYSIRLN